MLSCRKDKLFYRRKLHFFLFFDATYRKKHFICTKFWHGTLKSAP